MGENPLEPSGRNFLVAAGFPQDFQPIREGTAVTGITLAIVTVLYRLWDARWRIPFDYEADALLHQAYVKGIQENGWYLTNARLGAPLGQDARDFPLGGENFHWFSMKLIGYFVPDQFAVVNVYFILTFILVSLVTYFVARYLQLGVRAAMVVAVLFSFLPYHSLRGQHHLLRVGYFSVPLGALVVLWVISYRTEIFQGGDGGSLSLRRNRTIAIIAIAALLGASDTQYAIYTALLALFAAILCSWRDRSWRPTIVAVFVGAVIATSLLLNNIPFILNRIEDGPNRIATNRPLTDQDLYGLKAVELVLPVTEHRLSPLADLKERALEGMRITSEDTQTLGAFGTIGLLYVLLVFGASAIGDSNVSTARGSRAPPLIARLGMLSVIAILLGAIGGFSYLIAVLGFSMVRTWNRLSLFIGFFSLLGLDSLLESWWGNWSRSRNGGILASALVVALLTVGVYDQTPARRMPTYAATEMQLNTDAAFYRRIENLLPTSAMVFQFPAVDFPEPQPAGDMGIHAHLAAYLHTNDLRWSYGAMLGRPAAEWHQRLDAFSFSEQSVILAAMGFSGIVVDRDAYEDRVAEIEAGVAKYASEPTLISNDSRLSFVPLQGLRDRLVKNLGEGNIEKFTTSMLKSSFSIRWGDQVNSVETAGSQWMRWTFTPSASMEIENFTDAPITLDIDSFLEVGSGQSAEFVVTFNNVETTFEIIDGLGRWQQKIQVAPGIHRLDFHSNAAPVDA